MSTKLSKDHSFSSQREMDQIFDKFKFKSFEEDPFEEDLALRNELHSKNYNVSLYNKLCLDLTTDYSHCPKKRNKIHQIIKNDYNDQFTKNYVGNEDMNSLENILVEPIFVDYLEQQFSDQQKIQKRQLLKNKQKNIHNFFEYSSKELYYHSSSSSSSYSNFPSFNLNHNSSNSEDVSEDQQSLIINFESEKQLVQRKKKNEAMKNSDQVRTSKSKNSHKLCYFEKEKENENCFDQKKGLGEEIKLFQEKITKLFVKTTNKNKLEFLAFFQNSYLEEKKQIDLEQKKWIRIYLNKCIDDQVATKEKMNNDIYTIKKQFNSLSKALDKKFFSQLNRYIKTNNSHTKRKRRRSNNDKKIQNIKISNNKKKKFVKIKKSYNYTKNNFSLLDNNNYYFDIKKNKTKKNSLNIIQKNKRGMKKRVALTKKSSKVKRRRTNHKNNHYHMKNNRDHNKNIHKSSFKLNDDNVRDITNSNEYSLLPKRNLKSSKKISFINKKKIKSNH
ncbi:hypothetical protein M0812_25956 [Anaeramoeba flamelloides]|uniref:Uncharacterized protein n=1 Tax=Anaeramoeba flamelloides TaxID=1746091 RepID=A0AAV7YEX0_9EUKA|nr:hypothetical protein M0812_25956 [Anaeramoeba flamelloides]